MSDVKTVNIKGQAALDISGGSAKKGKRSTRKNQEGGAEEVRGVSPVMSVVKGVESQSAIAAQAAPINTASWLKYPTSAPVPPSIQPQPSHIPATPNQSAAPTGQYAVPTQAGGVKHVKVELKKKVSAKKVHLNPKKAEAPKAQIKKHATRKIRKVTIGVKSLHKRVTRAKKLHKEVKEMPLDKLKEKLIKGGLIKPNSKAPEAVLRQIAGDAEMMVKKAL